MEETKNTQINREEVAHIRRENIVNRKSGNNRKKTTTTAATTDDYDVSKSQSKPEWIINISVSLSLLVDIKHRTLQKVNCLEIGWVTKNNSRTETKTDYYEYGWRKESASWMHTEHSTLTAHTISRENQACTTTSNRQPKTLCNLTVAQIMHAKSSSTTIFFLFSLDNIHNRISGILHS